MYTQKITLRFLVLYKGSTMILEHTRELPADCAVIYIRGYVNAMCEGNRYDRWVLINPTPEQETEMRAVAQENAENGHKPIYPFTEVDQRQFAEVYGDV